jgi:hypothetical protein
VWRKLILRRARRPPAPRQLHHDPLRVFERYKRLRDLQLRNELERLMVGWFVVLGLCIVLAAIGCLLALRAIARC